MAGSFYAWSTQAPWDYPPLFLSLISKAWQLCLPVWPEAAASALCASLLMGSSRTPWRGFPAASSLVSLLPPLLPNGLFSTREPATGVLLKVFGSCCISAQSSPVAASSFSQNKIQSLHHGLQGPTSLGCLLSLSSCHHCAPATLTSLSSALLKKSFSNPPHTNLPHFRSLLGWSLH